MVTVIFYLTYNLKNLTRNLKNNKGEKKKKNKKDLLGGTEIEGYEVNLKCKNREY